MQFEAFNAQRGDKPFLSFVREGADPATVAILLEDGVAVTGVVVAAAGIVLARLTGQPALDALASIIIGLLLGFVALYLVVENRKLLLGKAVPIGVEESFVRILEQWPSVVSVHDVKTQQLTPEAYRLKAEVRFKPQYFASQLEDRRTGRSLADAEPSTTVLVARTIRMLSDDIDAMERAVKKVIPQALHIDIEIEQTPPLEDED